MRSRGATPGAIPGAPMNAAIVAHPSNPALVRLVWSGIAGAGTKGQASAGQCYADFDACPVRKLTAQESASIWARDVLGATVS